MQLYFSFSEYAKALAKVIQGSSIEHSFVIGITGPWGSGKTTLMETITSELDNNIFLSVRFNAWAHSKQDSIWRALFSSIISVLRKDLDNRFPKQSDGKRISKGIELENFLDDAERSLYTAFTKEIPGEVQLDLGSLVKTSAKLALRFVPWGNLGTIFSDLLSNKEKKATPSGEDSKDSKSDVELKSEDIDQLWGILKRDIVRHQILQIQSMEQFRLSIEHILKTTLADNRRLIVLIDDVDRCLPDQGLEVFEAIKLYLDLPGCVFLVAMDQDILQHALDIRYKQEPGILRRITAELYAEKMIDLTFSIPSYDNEEFNRYVAQLPKADVLTRNNNIISFALPNNLRTWERFSNRISLYIEIINQIAQQRKISSIWEKNNLESAFIKLQLLNFRWPAITRTLANLERLETLEKCVIEAKVESSEFRQAAADHSLREALRIRSTTASKLPDVIWSYLEEISLLKFLSCAPVLSEVQDQDLLQKIFYLDLPRA